MIGGRRDCHQNRWEGHTHTHRGIYTTGGSKKKQHTVPTHHLDGQRLRAAVQEAIRGGEGGGSRGGGRRGRATPEGAWPAPNVPNKHISGAGYGRLSATRGWVTSCFAPSSFSFSFAGTHDVTLFCWQRGPKGIELILQPTFHDDVSWCST